MSLFHHGKELFERFRLSVESEVTFTDYCSDLIFPYQSNIRFTSKSLILASPNDGYHDSGDDWIEVEALEFYPWQSILSLQNVKGDKIVEQFEQESILDWLSTLTDTPINFPYLEVRRGHLAFIVRGKPRSVRSVGGKRSFREKVEEKREEVMAVYPFPFGGNVEMKIDVFSSNAKGEDRPDIDRLSSLITDAFQGIVYFDDKQIRDLRPRIIDSSQAFKELECRSDPMGPFEVRVVRGTFVKY